MNELPTTERLVTHGSTAGAACGNCGVQNPPKGHFCSSCGQSLWENCPECKTPSIIGQSFCNACGKDLKQHLAGRLAAAEETLQLARRFVAEGRYKIAVSRLELLSTSTDFRFKQLREQALQLIAEATDLQRHWESKLPQVTQQADEFNSQHQWQALVELLESVPGGHQTERLSKLLQESRQKLGRVVKTKQSLKNSLAAKNWSAAMADLSELLLLAPEHKNYRDLLTQVIQKVFKQACQARDAGEYPEALALLREIPLEFQEAEHRQLHQDVDEIVFLRRLLAKAPFASPIVAGSIQRLQGITQDPLVGKLAARYKTLRSSSAPRQGLIWPSWMQLDPGWLGFPIAPSTLPTNIAGARPECLVRSGGQFWTAYGLALFALYQDSGTANFLDQPASGLLGMLARKRKQVVDKVWGIDIGDSSIKAICLSLGEQGPQIETAQLVPIDVPASSSEIRRADLTAVFRALEKLASEKLLENAVCVSNVPGSELLSRYMLLPSDKEKLHSTFIEQEAQANIPISLDLLSRSYWKSPHDPDKPLVQSAVLLAIRKAEIESRVSMFKKFGLGLAGLVGEPLALLRATSELDIPKQNESPAGVRDAKVVVEVGHLRTTILVRTQYNAWFRTLDWGLHDLNKAIANKHQLAIADADMWRRSPARAPHIQKALETMRESVTVPRRELERSLQAASEVTGRVKVTSAMLIGGGAYQALLGSWLNGEDI